MDIPRQDIIHLGKNRQVSNIYDVEMQGLDLLRKHDSVECHLVLYPYSRRITSDDYAFYPFEEYIKDVSSHQRSTFVPIHRAFNEVFGLMLGSLIALFFALFNPRDLLSVESIVSVFGAYIIGKELWDDIENTIIDLTGNWRISYRDSYYRYELERNTTLAHYSNLAKRKRYGKSSLMPEKIDFIKQSNSQTVRMFFDMRNLNVFAEPTVHILSIHIDPACVADMEIAGFLFGVKLSLNKTFGGLTQSLELFQSFSQGAKGCLNEQGEWIEDALFYRRTFSLGRIKYFASKGLIHGQSIVSAQLEEKASHEPPQPNTAPT